MANSKTVLACNYPLYSVVKVGNEEVVVTGGGGKAKTGVPNGIEIHRLILDSDSKCFSKCNLQHDMGGDLIMNLVKHPVRDVLAGGISHSMSLFQIHRPGSGSSQGDDIYLSGIGSVRTDFKEKQSYLNALQFNYDGNLIITGGSDCILRVWKFPNLQKFLELKQHENEIEHIASHFSTNEIVSLCRKGEALVWDISKGKLLKKFSLKSDTHRMKSCWYSPRTGADEMWFYSCCVPIKVMKNRAPQSYVLKWCSSSWKVHMKSGILKGLGCTMAISSNGLQIAVGTNEGSIYVINDNLKVLHKIARVHSVFVTGLTFIDLCKKIPVSSSASADSKFTQVILSVSVDKTCCATILPEAGNSSKLGLLVYVSVFLFFFLLIILMILL